MEISNPSPLNTPEVHFKKLQANSKQQLYLKKKKSSTDIFRGLSTFN